MAVTSNGGAVSDSIVLLYISASWVIFGGGGGEFCISGTNDDGDGIDDIDDICIGIDDIDDIDDICIGIDDICIGIDGIGLGSSEIIGVTCD